VVEDQTTLSPLSSKISRAVATALARSARISPNEI
jgi:hypothetical protein